MERSPARSNSLFNASRPLTGFAQSYQEQRQKAVLRISKPLHPIYYDEDFFSYLSRTAERSVSSVQQCAEWILPALYRPQRFLIDEPDYYVGLDLYTNTFYICYRRLMIIDIDDDPLPDLSQSPELFEIYRTRRGYHIFLISRYSDYRGEQDVQTMLNLGGDFLAIVWFHLRGCSVRLNRKRDEADPHLYHLVGRFGQGKPLPELEQQVKLHLQLVKELQDQDPCFMA